MNILLLNSILYSSEITPIQKIDSIKDCLFYNIGLGFKKLGHNVTLVAAADYEPLKNEKYEIDVIFIQSKIKKIFRPNVIPFQPFLLHFLRKKQEQFDLIISSETFAFPSFFASNIAARKMLIWHELASHNRKMKRLPSLFWYNVIARIFYRNVLVVARSENAKKFISSYVSRVSDTIVEHGINLDKFGISHSKKKRFIVVSQLIPRKNIKSILQKFSRFIIQPKYADFLLVIAGRGELEENLKGLTVELKIEKSVDFVGFKPHSVLNGFVAESMALLVDTMQDNNMVSIIESIASSTPVITNLIPKNSQMVDNHKLGIAKEWDEHDLERIVEDNNYYVENCIAYRRNLSNESCAQNLIDAFLRR